ncbi:anti-CRISPR protein AcrIIC3 [Neisseria meningitidis]|uniref:anti-CRISPR protein AcrIIC3 n=1 Tax=Neisseria meningitidis TaxID=487 RepID=UPI000E595343|nr:anti-CRISPR protein AcrIIC3 [Neisseria meningitidis]
MFKRAIIFTSFNGFEKVSRTEKRRLAKIINSRVSITDEYLRAKDTNASLDGQYRAFLFNDESPAMTEFLAKLKAFAESCTGISIDAWEIEESEYVRLPVERRDFLAAANGKEIFKI